MKRRNHPDRARRVELADQAPGERVHLAICIPGESMPLESVRALTRLVMRVMGHPPSPDGDRIPRDFTLSQHYFGSSMLPFSRTRVIESAARVGATHFLLLDSDMTFPEDLAHRLMVGTRRCGGFVAANCPTRRPPIRWTARQNDGQLHDSNATGDVRWSTVRSVGVAVAMLTADVWAKLERPAFNFAMTPGGWIGEDIWFCERLAQAGISPVVDNLISRQIGHVGPHEFTAAEVGPE